MSLTDRDRKIMMGIVPLLVIVAYWFLLLAPKRHDASALGEQLTQAQEKRDKAQAEASSVQGAKTDYAKDYEIVVRMGKAIPSAVDMPSLIVQLDDAAKGTGIHFTKIKTGERTEPTPAPAPAPAPTDSGDGAKPTDAGGQPAQSAPGGAVESANNASATSDQANKAAESQSGVDATTATQSKQGGLPVGGAAGSATTPTGGTQAPGLDSVPLEFEFNGSFFDLSDFFHRLKRFVRATNKKMEVRGRLITIDGLKFSAEDHFPSLKAEVKATVWLSPKEEGATAGATPAGPTTTPAATGSGGIAGSDSASTSTAAPTATVTP